MPPAPPAAEVRVRVPPAEGGPALIAGIGACDRFEHGEAAASTAEDVLDRVQHRAARVAKQREAPARAVPGAAPPE